MFEKFEEIVLDNLVKIVFGVILSAILLVLAGSVCATNARDKQCVDLCDGTPKRIGNICHCKHDNGSTEHIKMYDPVPSRQVPVNIHRW